MQNTAKQNYPGLVSFYDTRPGNKVSLFYNAPEPTRARERKANRRKDTDSQTDIPVETYEHTIHTSDPFLYVLLSHSTSSNTLHGAWYFLGRSGRVIVPTKRQYLICLSYCSWQSLNQLTNSRAMSVRFSYQRTDDDDDDNLCHVW